MPCLSTFQQVLGSQLLFLAWVQGQAGVGKSLWLSARPYPSRLVLANQMWLLTYRAAVPFTLAPGFEPAQNEVPLTPPASETRVTMALPQEEVLNHYKKLLFQTYCQTWEGKLYLRSVVLNIKFSKD